MSDIFATLAAGTPRPTALTAGEIPVRVVDPSPDLARMATGESLRGTVVGNDGHGHVVVRTQHGQIQLSGARGLPVGTEVILQVRSVGPQVVMTLLPLESGGAAAPATHAQAPQAPTTVPALPPNPADLVQRGQTLRGLLQAAPPIPLLAGLPTAEPGTELLVRILSLGIQSAAAPTTPAAAGTAAAPGSQAPGTAPQSGTLPANAALPNTTTGGQPIAPGGTPGQRPAAAAAPAAAPAIGQLPPGSAGAAAGTAAGGALAAAPIPGGAAAPATAGGATGTAAATTQGTPAQAPPVQTSPVQAASAPGLRMAPQTPLANSGHTLATALQSISTEAASRAAGSLATATPAASPGGTAGAAAPPTGTGTPAGGESSGLRLTGLVTAQTNSGQPVVHTPLGTLTLSTRATLPLGSSLALEVALPTAAGPAALQSLAAAWPSLEALEDTLFSTLAPAQVDAVARALPQIGPRLASGLLFFLSALNQGSFGGWLAPAAAAAEQAERNELYERLGRELTGLNRTVDTTSGEWRFVNLPLWSEQGLRELRCFFRNQGQGGGKDGGEKATRFVLELELKQHGELQLDGLVRRQQFDLVLRSRRPLPAVARGDLRALFEEANAIGGYKGQLVFQSSRDWLQMLSAQSQDKPHDGLTV
jgi:hypothetical protein